MKETHTHREAATESLCLCVELGGSEGGGRDMTTRLEICVCEKQLDREKDRNKEVTTKRHVCGGVGGSLREREKK